MRKLTRLFAGTVTMAAAAALVAGTVSTASADPIGKNGKAVTPAAFDVIGVGSNTTQYVMDQLSLDFNNTIASSKHSASHPYLYSWDATGSATITTKSGCGGKKAIARPNGSGAGLTALEDSAKTSSDWCVDYARSSSGRGSSSPVFGPGGVAYVPFARDAITYATRTTKAGGTDAPANLTTADLTGIYSCTITNWATVGGKSATILPYLPQTNSGTRKTFLADIGVATPGSCVTSGPEENEGTNSALDNAAVIYPFSVGAYIEQAFHSAACGKKPTASQNQFGCNAVGVLGLDSINGIAPTSGSGTKTVINTKFADTSFGRKLYNIVRYATTADHIPAYEEAIFASKARKGFICSNSVAAKDIVDYGFLPVSTCGIGS